ncbi:MAG: MBL fold metallo-hydrolase [Chloroflexi bacterium]|nr:MBL fold metallo-hydrolase [Chloroflexota bacterium]
MVASVGLAACTPGAPSAQLPAVQPGDPTLEWFGWSHFRITTRDGRVILLNPFVTGNPDASITLDAITKVDYILAPNGHGDEIGDTIAIAQKTGAKVIAGGFEMGSWFIQKGIPSAQVVRSNPGNFHDLGGNVIVRVVNSVHGSGLPSPTIENPYGGPAAGFFITLGNKPYTVYFAGSTAATMDMEMWGSAYKPDLAILPLNNNRDPADVGFMVKLLSKDNPNLKRVIPHHQRVQPPAGATTIDQMEQAIQATGSKVTVIRLQRGQTIPLKR